DRLFDGQNIAPPTLPKNAKNGWFVRDVEAGSALRPIAPGAATLGLRLDTTGSGTVVRGTLRNLQTKTRAVTVYYVERFDATEPVWWNSVRDGVSAKEIREYANLTQAGAGATGQLSQYPWGCVTGRGTGRALAVPPDIAPRVARIAYRPDTRLLFLCYDLALTERGDPAHHDQAPVGIARYAVDPAWGFRDAAARYYALFPEAFQRRAKAEGIWMPFTDPAKVAGMDDFSIAYHEGDNSVASDRAKGILSFKYVEPMTYWMPMAKGVPRTYAEATALVQKIAASDDPVASHQAQAVLSSGSHDVRGRFNVAFRDAPWCDGAVWVLNPSPAIVHANLWTKARLNNEAKPAPGAKNQPDGAYLDSLEAWADVQDFRAESLNATSVSLCFAPGRFRPMLPTWFSVYESTAALSRDLHKQGSLLMANSVPWRFAAFASLLDVMGTETSMFTETGAWSPETDAVMNLRRTMSYHKPYLLLLNTDFNKVNKDGITRYFERCAFYGIYPSMFSVDAATDPYWENPTLYNRDRPVFQRVIPVIKRLSAAGWEPVTWAKTNRSDVWLERFGREYLTVLNSADKPAEVVVRVDARFFGGATRRGAKIAVCDVWGNKELLTASPQGTIPVRLSLGAGETRVLSLKVTNTKTVARSVNK
ncbi:MAG: hypothetical protein H7Y38_02595, partial [Armatimonadetes bacterium]|nr:hypothetical protein [Armatimonadota bacterium]